MVRAGLSKVANSANPAGSVAREVASQLPADAAAIMARQERIAPGASMVADLTDETVALTRGLGHDAKAVAQAKQLAADHVSKVADGLDQVRARYKPHQGHQVSVTPEVEAILKPYKIVSNNGSASFEELQALRTRLKENIRNRKRGSVKHDLGPKLRELDRRFTMRSLRSRTSIGTSPSRRIG